MYGTFTEIDLTGMLDASNDDTINIEIHFIAIFVDESCGFTITAGISKRFIEIVDLPNIIF